MMDLTSFEAEVRLTAFLSIFALLAMAEAAAPRRRRLVARPSRWPGNLGLVAVDTILVRAVPVASAIAISNLAEARDWGLLRALGTVPTWAAVAVSVVLLDLAVYLQHVLFHALPALWRLHRVHHTDPELDVTTGVRFHPVEILMSAGVKGAVVGALGARVVRVVGFDIVLNAGSMFSHANLRLSGAADRLLRRLFVTPDMHRVHHSIDTAEMNRNFGFTLSLWDRLFGTYEAQPRMGHAAMVIGVTGFDGPDVRTLRRLLVQPLLREREPRADREPTEATDRSAAL